MKRQDNCVGVMRNAGHEAALGASGTAFARGGTAVFAAGFYLGGISPEVLPLWSAPPGQMRLRSLPQQARSEEHTSELQSLMRISYAVFCLKKKKQSTSDKWYQLVNMLKP